MGLRGLIFAAVSLAALGGFADDPIERALGERPGTFNGKSLDTFAFDCAYAKVVEADLRADAAWTDLKTSAEIAAYRRQLHARALEAIGGLPERTPLNVRSFGRVQRDGYAVEKLVFESSPGFFVTANLFLPTTPAFAAPYPGVVVTCGHSSDVGKLDPSYQRACVLLAKAGFAALVYDPLDQGERAQIRGEEPAGVHGHTAVGLRAALLGGSAARFRIWDGIRAHDLLRSRPEVDPARTAVTGMSGGGTLSAYLNALDWRFRAAAPMGYLTSMRALIDRCGPQDAEQNVFGQLAIGLNHLSWMVLNGQSALCPGFTYGDFFAYEGACSTFEKARRVFACEGRADRLACVTCPGQHGWYESERLALTGWFRRHLRGERDAWPADIAALRRLDVGFRYDAVDVGLAGLPDGTVLGGRGVLSLTGARSAYDLMADELLRLEASRPKTPDRKAVRRACGITEPTFAALAETEESAGDVTIRRVCLEQADGFRAFVTAFLPRDAKGVPAVIASDTLAPTSLVAQVRRHLAGGRPVAVVEARAFGPSATRYPRSTYWARKGLDQEIAVFFYWQGRNLAICRAEDYLAVGRWFAKLTGSPAELQAEGGAVVAAAHAYYFGRDRFSAFTPKSAPPSWAETVRRPSAPPPRMSDVVQGALKVYDWPQLCLRVNEGS